MRILAYSCAFDAEDKYVRLGDSTTDKILREFVNSVIDNFVDE